MISTTYDAEADAIYVRIAAKDAAVADTREIEPGVILDMDATGRVIGIESWAWRGARPNPPWPRDQKIKRDRFPFDPARYR